MKKLTLLIAIFALGGFASAQTQSAPVPLVDHWSTVEECLAATNAPFYHPTIIQQQKLEKDEAVYGLPQGGCVEMDLPDRLGGRGFVRVETGREFAFNKATGKMLRLKECNNKSYTFLPFPSPPIPRDGIDGQDGIDGRPGRDGERGRQGFPGADGRDGATGPAGPHGPAGLAIPPKKGHGKLIAGLIVGGTAAAVGIVLATRGGGEEVTTSHLKPVVTTLVPTKMVGVGIRFSFGGRR